MSNDRNNAGQALAEKRKPHRLHNERKGWAILAGCFCMVAVFILLAITTDFTSPLFSHVSLKREMQSAKSKVTRNGTIVLQVGENRCEYRKFDNDSGSMTIESIKDCSNADVGDQHGAQPQNGKFRRLDSISKSFGNAH